jgi:hypothetical protein
VLRATAEFLAAARVLGGVMAPPVPMALTAPALMALALMARAAMPHPHLP